MTCVRRWALAAVCLAGCGLAPTLRFQNRDAVGIVDDRRDIEKPRPYPRADISYHAQHSYYRPLVRWLEVPAETLAKNVNALDEVPDSTWFQNRIGMRDLSPADIVRGPAGSGGPDPTRPWLVLETKSAGTQPGILIRDARGYRYIIKFDKLDRPEMESGAEVVVQRLLWAVGYHVPLNDVVFFDRRQLVIAAAATRQVGDTELPLTTTELDRLLAGVARAPDGRFRALASRYLPGEPLGGYLPEGTRRDDPNDVVPHEHRRDLRGQYVFFAWLAHTDVHHGNRLDMWVEDPVTGARYVVHYLVDFGRALGVGAAVSGKEFESFAYFWDPKYMSLSLLAFGAWQRPWEKVRSPPLRGVGRFESRQFDPGDFRPLFHLMFMARRTVHDDFWAAKIMMRLGPDHVRAAVSTGRYSDPRAREYITRTLIERQRKLARWAFTRIVPLDRFEIEHRNGVLRLCALDLLVHHGLARPGEARRYAAHAYARTGRPLPGSARAAPAPDGHLCLDHLSPGRDADGYVMVRVELDHTGPRLPPLWVHAARDSHGALRIVGIYRGS